ncbi:hypothetical protein [Roseovarius atlanticus]|uniref:hypothetical protein n=1 Tax=Roseovarius atlanticus TaxID=1641875 RepID=UPI001C972F92|nr:hypothetical protein [Roseovarius atlanticus]MBY5986360.1 hypothetical protein [Roseovarius atlanticus]MBY6125000.1 hypothetical protein [Roseovarius atlanticus]MBY6150539.1 hypothetical protein [Roseovarius atlanticus]
MTTLFKALSLSLASAAALPALACPGPEDLKKGVVFETQDGTVETHRQLATDVIVIQTEFADGSGSILETRHGLYLASSVPIEDGVVRVAEKEVFASYDELDKWQEPKPDADWSNDSSGGGTATSGPMQTINLGPCAYPAFEIDMSFNDDPSYTERYHYLPEMGVGLLVSSSSSGDEEVYTYTDVRVAD